MAFLINILVHLVAIARTSSQHEDLADTLSIAGGRALKATTQRYLSDILAAWRCIHKQLVRAHEPNPTGILEQRFMEDEALLSLYLQFGCRRSFGLVFLKSMTDEAKEKLGVCTVFSQRTGWMLG